MRFVMATRSLVREVFARLGLGPRCPICGGTEFVAFRGRPDAECTGCRAKERQRMLALFLPRLRPDPRNADLPVVHFAPEVAISGLLRARFPDTYMAADINPPRYAKIGVPVARVDMTDPLASFAPGSVAGFVHSHVLEHLPVPLGGVLRDLNACIAPGGFHIFQLPVYPGPTDEDLSPDMSPEVRLQRFGHVEHMRRIGTEDVERDLVRHMAGFDRVRIADVVSARAVARAAIPASARTEDTPHSLFVFLKRG
jgi:hypothetical protein